MSNSATSWTVACQAPLSMGFPRQEYWTGLPFPSPNPRTELAFLMSPALAGGFFTTRDTWEAILSGQMKLKDQICALLQLLRWL